MKKSLDFFVKGCLSIDLDSKEIYNKPDSGSILQDIRFCLKFGNKVEDAFKVITVYKTSKIDKYWIKESI